MEEVNHGHGLGSSLRFGLLERRMPLGKRSERGLAGKAGLF